MWRVWLSAVAAVPLGTSEPHDTTTMEIIAHRGASYDAPENTLTAVRLAWQQNADAVEVDVFLTKDDRIVAFHDENTKRLGGRDKKVIDQTLSELRQLDVGLWKGERWQGERIPLLTDVLATVPSGKCLFIEVKCGREIVPKLKHVLSESGLAPDEVTVLGLSRETMRAVKQALLQHRVYWVVKRQKNRHTGRWLPPVEQLIQQAKTAGLDGLDVKCAPVIDRDFVAPVKQAGLKLFVWTVNSPLEARRLQAAGVDGVTTDRPGWLRERLSATNR